MTDAASFSEPSTTDDKSPRVWTVFAAVFLALVLAILFQAIMGVVLGLVEVSRGTKPADLAQAITGKLTSPYMLILTMALGQLGFFIAGFVPALRSPLSFRRRVAWVKPLPSWHVYPIAMLGSIAPLAVGLTSAESIAKVIPPDTTFEGFFDALTLDSAIVFVLFIGIAPGIIEEVLFRGYMQTRLVKRWGAVTGITVTSVLFALVHVMPHAIAAAAPLGFWFGYIAWRSQSVLPGIMCHFFVNSGLNLWRVIVKFGEIPEATQTMVQTIAILIGVICFAICCWSGFWTRKHKQTATVANIEN